MSERMTWVVPCYNEADRLDGDAFVSLVDEEPGVTVLFVNDGSNDQTEERLHQVCAKRPGRMDAFSLEQNQGKAQAVRRGLSRALADGATVVGYLDADLATPIGEARRLQRIISSRDIDVLLGSRVALLGRVVKRHLLRHLVGRVFATGASLALDLPVYDTQCGAKLFRRTPALEAALVDPFLSRWAFDVELIGRLLAGAPGAPGLPPERIMEEPLLEWRDVPGSKVRPLTAVLTGLELGKIAWDLKARRQALR